MVDRRHDPLDAQKLGTVSAALTEVIAAVVGMPPDRVHENLASLRAAVGRAVAVLEDPEIGQAELARAMEHDLRQIASLQEQMLPTPPPGFSDGYDPERGARERIENARRGFEHTLILIRRGAEEALRRVMERTIANKREVLQKNAVDAIIQASQVAKLLGLTIDQFRNRVKRQSRGFEHLRDPRNRGPGGRGYRRSALLKCPRGPEADPALWRDLADNAEQVEAERARYRKATGQAQ